MSRSLRGLERPRLWPATAAEHVPTLGGRISAIALSLSTPQSSSSPYNSGRNAWCIANKCLYRTHLPGHLKEKLTPFQQLIGCGGPSMTYIYYSPSIAQHPRYSINRHLTYMRRKGGARKSRRERTINHALHA